MARRGVRLPDRQYVLDVHCTDGRGLIVVAGSGGMVTRSTDWGAAWQRGRLLRAQGGSVKVKRVVSNVATSDMDKASAFYGEILGLKVLMDLGWIRTYGSSAKMTIQLSVMSEGGSGTAVPDMSIEVDNVEEALMRVRKAGIAIEYGPATEPWGVRRFYVRDPFGNLVNILQHE